MTENEWRGGLTAEQDFILAEKPSNPAFLESANFWLFGDNGEFAIPRTEVQSSGERWDHHVVQLHAVTADGRAFFDPQELGQNEPVFGTDGKPRVLGSGPLRMEMVEPYRKWRLHYDGLPIETTVAELVTKGRNAATDPSSGLKRTPLKVELELDMVAPCWVQDNPEAKLKDLNPREQADAKAMGIGYRMEQLCRGRGTYTLDGETRDFTCTGLRVHRQSYRPLGGFRGHVWQSAVFPDGRAFGHCVYPPGEDGSTHNDGYVYSGGKFYPAKAKTIPWFKEKIAEGEDVSVELESALGVTRISGRSKFNTFSEYVFGPGTFNFNQGGALFEWDGQQAYGMMERSFFQKN